MNNLKKLHKQLYMFFILKGYNENNTSTNRHREIHKKAKEKEMKLRISFLELFDDK